MLVLSARRVTLPVRTRVPDLGPDFFKRHGRLRIQAIAQGEHLALAGAQPVVSWE